jgi:hypothetical protein
VEDAVGTGDPAAAWVAIALAIVTVASAAALMGIDDFGELAPWMWPFALGWLGTYALYPAWSLLFGWSVSPE